MSVHVFLSPGWIGAMRAIRDEYADRVDPPTIDIAANVTVTEAPFEPTTVFGHIDTTGPVLTIDEGHVEHAHFTVEMPYELAHQVFVERDPGTVMSILVGGRVKLTGDSSRVLALAGAAAPPDPQSETGGLAREILRRIDDVTR